MPATVPLNKYLPGIDAGFYLGALGRITTGNRDGASVTIPSTHAPGEAIELRYSSQKTGQFQGLFVQVEGQGAAGTVRGAEFVGRQGSGVALSEATGLHAQGQVRGSANVDVARGLHGQVSVFSGYSGTLALAAALYGKFQTEGAITEGYGCLVENEAVNGGVALTAAFGAKTTGEAPLFKSIFDTRGAGLEVINTNQVRVGAFRDAAGSDKMIVYDPDSATVLSVADYA